MNTDRITAIADIVSRPGWVTVTRGTMETEECEVSCMKKRDLSKKQRRWLESRNKWQDRIGRIGNRALASEKAHGGPGPECSICDRPLIHCGCEH